MKKFLTVLATIPFLASCGGNSSSVGLTASGATFPAPFYTRIFSNYSKESGNRVNYQAVGSGAGVRQFFAGTIDFGASDKAVPDEKIDQPLVQIPIVGGAIVPAYNKPGCDLKLTQRQLADVYLGKITNWSKLGCDEGRIIVVYRSDGAGTTAGWTNSLSAFSPEWREKVGTSKAVAWPVGIGAKGNSGVAAQIQNVDGAIGYLNYGYVSGGKFQEALIQNKAGNYVKANAETSSAGLSQIVLDSQLRGSNPNPGGENSYPIVSLTWILASPDYRKNDTIKEVLRYMLSEESQSQADALGYVPLPENLRQQSLESVDSLINTTS